ncbi:MAG: DUF4261 domain-containing protein [Deltaproteobacteria bacterium]|nr:DUF4261 domain-containing protein [Deltaproteobacteria bacterium]
MAILDLLRKKALPAHPIVAYALLDAPREPDVEEIATALRMGDAGTDVVVPSEGAARGLTVAGEGFALTLIPMPFPWSDLEGPCATAWWWPEAADVLRSANAHLIVAATGASGDPFERHLRATSVVAAVIASTKSLGVYWGGAATVHAAAEFTAQADAASRELLPLRLWVDFRIEPQGNDHFLFATTGLSAFGLMEVECVAHVGSPDEIERLDGRVFSVAHYLCDHGPVLLDGHTIGMSEDEHIQIRHQASCWPGRGKVIRLYL